MSHKSVNLKPLDTIPRYERVDGYSNYSTQYTPRKYYHAEESTQSRQEVSPRRIASTKYKSQVASVNNQTNPFASLRNKVIDDSPAKVRSHQPPTHTTDDKHTNWHIVVGIAQSKITTQQYVTVGAFSFSDKKMPKRGREKIVTLTNGDKCVIMDHEIKFKIPTGGGLINTIQRMFPGSQRLLKKSQFITHILPNPAQLSGFDDSQALFEPIRAMVPIIRYVYVKLVNEIRKFYNCEIKLSQIMFESNDSNTNSPVQSNNSTPTVSPIQSPLNSPTGAPVAAPNFAEIVRRPAAQPDIIMIPKDTTKPATADMPVVAPPPKLRTDIARFYIIDASQSQLEDLGNACDICPRK